MKDFTQRLYWLDELYWSDSKFNPRRRISYYEKDVKVIMIKDKIDG